MRNSILETLVLNDLNDLEDEVFLDIGKLVPYLKNIRYLIYLHYTNIIMYSCIIFFDI